MTLMILGFTIGFLIPAVASRFGKVLPADPGRILKTLWHKPHFPKDSSVARNRLLKAKWIRFGIRSLGWGLILSILFGASQIFLSPDLAPYAPIFITIVCLGIVVDAQYFLLPDFLTIPLLLSGFAVSLAASALSPEASIAGAIFGYGVSTLAGLMMRHPASELGGGDVKMLTGMGAWLGILGLNFTLVLSFLLFAAAATWLNRRSGAYGPALGVAGLLSLFLVYWI